MHDAIELDGPRTLCSSSSVGTILPPAMMRTSLLLQALIVASLTAHAAPVSHDERQAILDAIRPRAAHMAGQPVKIRVDKLNVDGGWALLMGELVSPDGGRLDWQLSEECNNSDDKGLDVLLNKMDGVWRVDNLSICSVEPMTWHIDEYYDGFKLPCGLYEGLDDPDSTQVPLIDQCRAHHAENQRRLKK